MGVGGCEGGVIGSITSESSAGRIASGRETPAIRSAAGRHRHFLEKIRVRLVLSGARESSHIHPLRDP
jgi:hypothetical protein